MYIGLNNTYNFLSIHGKKDGWKEDNSYPYNNNKIMLENLQIHNFS